MDSEKVISIEDRIPKLKEARKKRANRKLIIYLSVFFLLIAIIVYLQSPFSHIKVIETIGNDMIDSEEIIESSGLTYQTNIWSINFTETASHISKHPIIQSAVVTRQLPNTIKITVTEHDIVAFIKNDGLYYPVLSNGKVVEQHSPIDSSEAPLLSNFTDEIFLERMAKELHATPKHIFNLISEIAWEPTKSNRYKIMMYMNDGFVVQGTIRNFASKMEAYPSIVAQLDPNEKGIVHMGVGTYFEKLEKESEIPLQEVPISE